MVVVCIIVCLCMCECVCVCVGGVHVWLYVRGWGGWGGVVCVVMSMCECVHVQSVCLREGAREISVCFAHCV